MALLRCEKCGKVYRSTTLKEEFFKRCDFCKGDLVDMATIIASNKKKEEEKKK